MAEISFRQVLNDTLREEMRRDENVFVMGEEIGNFEGSYKITAGLLKEFGPKRVVDTPICENGFVGMAVGGGLPWLRPGVGDHNFYFISLGVGENFEHAPEDF